MHKEFIAQLKEISEEDKEKMHKALENRNDTIEFVNNFGKNKKIDIDVATIVTKFEGIGNAR